MISTISLQEYYQKFVKIELKLLPLSGEKLHRRATNRLNEERLDIRVRGFWNSSQQAFFDIRVFDPNACRYLNKSRQQCHAMNKHEKKRLYNKQMLQVDHGTFTPLVFSVYSSKGRECKMFYSWLSDKRNLSKSITMNGLERLFCTSKIESPLFTRCSRTVCRKVSEFECGIDVLVKPAKI